MCSRSSPKLALCAHRFHAHDFTPTLRPPACTEDLRHESEMAKSLVVASLLWAQPVAMLLLSARQPLVARPLRQPLFARRGAPLLQEKMPKGELVPSDDDVATGETKLLTAADEEAVGLLVEDEEWLGLGTEMFIVLRSAMRESLKKNVREFTGSDDYKLGDVSKEADRRIKEEVAKLRGKEDYELGDLSIVIDEMVKEEVANPN